MRKRIVSLNGSSLTIKDVIDAGEGSVAFEIDESAIIAMTESRSAVKRILEKGEVVYGINTCLLYTSPSPRDGLLSRMPSSA